MKNDRATEEKLSALLSDVPGFSSAVCYRVLPSTNDEAKALAEAGANEGTVVLAGAQTAGRGRMGRHFYSPEHNGLYMSLILRPDKARQDAGLLTACAAVAVYRAVLELTGVSTHIKWVNDVCFDNKKLCGILAEGQIAADGQFSYVVLGVGVNITPPQNGYADEIQDTAISLFEITKNAVPDRITLCAAIVRHWFLLYEQLLKREFLDDYRERSCILGEEISYIKDGEKHFGRAISIDEQARLVVTGPNGREIHLGTGEVSTVRRDL